MLVGTQHFHEPYDHMFKIYQFNSIHRYAKTQFFAHPLQNCSTHRSKNFQFYFFQVNPSAPKKIAVLEFNSSSTGISTVPSDRRTVSAFSPQPMLWFSDQKPGPQVEPYRPKKTAAFFSLHHSYHIFCFLKLIFCPRSFSLNKFISRNRNTTTISPSTVCFDIQVAEQFLHGEPLHQNLLQSIPHL